MQMHDLEPMYHPCQCFSKPGRAIDPSKSPRRKIPHFYTVHIDGTPERNVAVLFPIHVGRENVHVMTQI
jgi:hypothetical protein